MTTDGGTRTRLTARADHRSRLVHGLGDIKPPFLVVGRVMRCHGPCDLNVDVLEASEGAGPVNDSRHRFLDPDTYVCGDCLVTGEEDIRT